MADLHEFRLHLLRIDGQTARTRGASTVAIRAGCVSSDLPVPDCDTGSLRRNGVGYL